MLIIGRGVYYVLNIQERCVIMVKLFNKMTLTKRVGLSLSAVILGVALLVPAAKTFAQSQSCWSDTIPLTSTAAQSRSIFCILQGEGKDTAAAAGNTWVDDFNHGLLEAPFPTSSYQVYDNLGGIEQSKHWLHNDHWMVDIAPNAVDDQYPGGNVGGAMIRPNQSFTFQNGMLSVENVVSAGHEDYTGNNWHEVILTTADAPHTDYFKGLYGDEQFTGHWSLGMRMQADRLPIVALFRPDGEREWEASFWQMAGTENFGGGPWGELENVWRVCPADAQDMGCRDDFRWEVTANSVTLYVNGHKYWSQTGLAMPAELVTGNNYVYMASMTWREPAKTVRFHWDNLRINKPMGSLPEPTHSPHPTVTPSPTATPAPAHNAEDFANKTLEYFGAPKTNKNINYLKKLYNTILVKLVF